MLFSAVMSLRCDFNCAPSVGIGVRGPVIVLAKAGIDSFYCFLGATYNMIMLAKAGILSIAFSAPGTA